MKTLKWLAFFIVYSILMFYSVSGAVEWATPDRAAIAWDEVPGATYNVYRAAYEDKANPVLLGNTGKLEFIVTFDSWGKYVVGVSAVKDGEESVINWSDVNGDETPVPFAYKVSFPPTNLRRAE